jgi:hypothetical protein
MGSLARLSALPAAERRLLLAAAGLLTAIRVALWTLPFRSVYGAVCSRGPSPRRAAAGEPAPERIVWAVEVAARRVPRATCLVRALAAQALLARHGHASQLRLGVARGASRAFEAHAWLEADGRILIGGATRERYVPLPSLDSRP